MDAAPVYSISRACITSDLLSATEAERLFATRDCEGSVQAGFTFWSESDGLRLVRYHVTPISREAGH